MEINNEVITDYPTVKRINSYLQTSEYATSDNWVLNIIVNQCPDRISTLFQTIVDNWITNDYKIVCQFLFGSSDHEKENKILAETYFGGLIWPVSIIKQENIDNKSTWSTVITAVKSKSLKPVYDGDNIVGNSFRDEHASYCYLAGVLPQVFKKSKAFQMLLKKFS